MVSAILSGSRTVLSGLSEKAEFIYLGFGLTLFIVRTVLVLTFLSKRDEGGAKVRFFYFGFLFAVIPFCALSTFTTRSGVFSYIGFSVLLATLIQQYFYDKNFRFFKITFITIALVFHLFIPIGFSLFVSLAPAEEKKANFIVDLEHALPSASNGYTVYLNYPSEVNAMFLPYTWKAEGIAEPLGLIRLVPGLNTYTLTRDDEKVFRLKSNYHFVLNQHAKLKSKYSNIPETGLLYGLKEALGFTANNSNQFKVGDKIKLKNFNVEILAIKDNLPSELLIIFPENIDMNLFEWRIWKWESFDFEATLPPIIGKSIVLKNQWDEILQ